MLRLVRTEAGSARSQRAGQIQAAPGERSAPRSRWSGMVFRKGEAGGYVLSGLAGVMLGMVFFSVVLSSSPDSATAIYQRPDSFVHACEAAAAEISRLRRGTIFSDDCSAPVVTPIFGEEGRVIVRRTAEGEQDDDGAHVTFSVKMDGRSAEKWHALEIRRAPSRLTLDASLLSTARAAAPMSMRR